MEGLSTKIALREEAPLSAQSAVTRPVTVAGGVFAPGHLGELTTLVPFESVDAVVEETRSVQRRLRDLPSRVGVYFLPAMCLFPEIGYRLVRQKTTTDPIAAAPSPASTSPSSIFAALQQRDRNTA